MQIFFLLSFAIEISQSTQSNLDAYSYLSLQLICIPPRVPGGLALISASFTTQNEPSPPSERRRARGDAVATTNRNDDGGNVIDVILPAREFPLQSRAGSAPTARAPDHTGDSRRRRHAPPVNAAAVRPTLVNE